MAEEEINLNMLVDAVSWAKEFPELTLVFEGGDGKLFVGNGGTPDLAALFITARNHSERVGGIVPRENFDNATCCIAFHSVESVDVFINNLQEIKEAMENGRFSK